MFKKMFAILLPIITVMLLALSTNVFANAGQQPYTVEPILPASQDALIKNYISITTDKPIKEELKFLVRNKTNEEIIVKVRGFDTLTSAYGVLQYKKYDKEKDISLLTDKEYYFSQYVQEEQEITLGPTETKEVTVTVDVPVVKGHILGGIAFTSLVPGEVQKEENVQFKINNEMNTIIAFMGKFDDKSTNTLTYKKPWIQSMPSYYSIFLPTIHDTAKLTQKTKLEYAVYNKEGEVLFESKDKVTLDFAPKSETVINFKWEAAEIKVKEPYRLKGKIVVNENEEFPFDFPIELEDDSYTSVESIKENIDTVVVEDNSKWIYIAIGGGVFLVLLLILLLALRKKKYVLLSDTNEIVSPIDAQHVLYASVILEKEKNDSPNRNAKFIHYYKRVKTTNKDTNEKEYVYQYVKTETNSNYKSDTQ